ncbi:alpha/beta hydrolase [Actinacidiphila paucisporea]|uniref:Tripeptidyl-peptidase C. Serine peptidase. MEROPS family S33 n=1 Tax=Actinacidiphila paucisporea TaxID=310782 RepID=A0A1M6WKS5_9ACTN|nr:alpha/beta hydrolase [Actinacidiphila paucisporea]SHK94189.1 tripeptidyl-peptidase C. Serine peptidase. MEROPS family S33 [Actinacidiphila paucisporea]
MARMRTVAAVAAALAATALAAPPRAGSSATPAPYGQKISWAGCSGVQGPTAMECGTLTVPRDYAHPRKSDDLDIAVSRIPATGPGPRLGSLVVNFGGPGIPGITELAQRTAAGELGRLNRRYDLIGFDARGTGRSSPVDCGDLAGVTATDPVAQARQVAQACRRHSGGLLPWVGTPNAARDLDVVRSALGDDRLSYLGFSYGGRLGSVYAHEFPQHTGRVVLDGVPDPTLDDTQTALAQAAAFQHALGDFAADCAARGCPVPGRTGADVVAGIAATSRSLGGNGVATVSGRLDRAGFLQGVQNALYSKDDWPFLRDALGALRGGDGEPMMQLAYPGQLGVAPAPVASTWSAPDNYEMAKLAIDCRDTPERHSAAAVHALDGRFAAASPVFGPTIEATLLSCSGWAPGDPASRRVSAPSAPEALLVSTTADPATPYPGAAHMAAALGNGSRVLTYRGEGHGAYFAHNRCVTSTVEAYLLDGAMPARGAVC